MCPRLRLDVGPFILLVPVRLHGLSVFRSDDRLVTAPAGLVGDAERMLEVLETLWLSRLRVRIERVAGRPRRGVLGQVTTESSVPTLEEWVDHGEVADDDGDKGLAAGPFA